MNAKQRRKVVWVFLPFLIYNTKNHLFKLPILHPLMRVVSKKKQSSLPPDVFNWLHSECYQELLKQC